MDEYLKFRNLQSFEFVAGSMLGLGYCISRDALYRGRDTSGDVEMTSDDDVIQRRIDNAYKTAVGIIGESTKHDKKLFYTHFIITNLY